MEISALAIYRPTWADERGRRQVGPDEDVATLAVSAGRLLGDQLRDVERVVLVTRRPDALLGTTPEVVLEGLGLDPATPLVERLGGAPATVDALLSSSAGTLVLAVDPRAPAAAAAALLGPGPLTVMRSGELRHSIPVRTLPLPGADDLVYDDPRLLRERGWKRVVRELGVEPGNRPVAVAGISAGDAAKLAPGALQGVLETEATSALLVLAGLARAQQDARLIAVENGHGVAADVRVSGDVPVVTQERRPLVSPATWAPSVPADIPASLAAYERAFEAKVGLKAGVCSCGEKHHPPRARCQSCGAQDSQHLEILPREATIYSVVTVRAGVPGMTVPYSLAVVDLEGTGLRLLAHVTDDQPGSTSIGAPGQMVLRRVAVRAGVPDYGYAFQPEEKQ